MVSSALTLPLAHFIPRAPPRGGRAADHQYRSALNGEGDWDLSTLGSAVNIPNLQSPAAGQTIAKRKYV
jgi:hypothetical protein